MEEIPKIIHQIWCDIGTPLPKHFRLFGETWKEQHPTWKYELWDNKRINNFIGDYYPQFWGIYKSFKYDVQRMDVIRYLILDKIGGMYVDFDVECMRPHDKLITGKTCCFSKEPESHRLRFNKSVYFNNALMACIPEHPFMKKIIETVFSYVPNNKQLDLEPRFMEIMTTTGPLALVDIYEKYPKKELIFLIPAEQVSPFDVRESKLIRQGFELKKLDNKLKGVYSVHYFWSSWVNE